ncbi:hypothetical protein J4457_05475 [Candidatus Woesearchaeota archaeon]|nr:hypothetical protein [Candidatus Woesearchaeota archaeon]
MAQIILPIAALILLLLMTPLLTSVFLGVTTGIEDLFVKETAEEAFKGTIPGRPNIVTMCSFILIAITAILMMFNPKNLEKHLLWIGLIISILGVIAIIGYIVNIPLLYYSIPKLVTPIAFNTAILFVLTGVGLFLASSDKSKIMNGDKK